MTESYARMVARNACFWSWPLLNIYSRRIAYGQVPEPGLMGGVVPVAPPNRLSMLTDYVDPQERIVACPNQDVIYGTGGIALDLSPVVIQVPDFGALLGLSGGGPAQRQLCQPRHDVWHDPRLLSPRCTGLAGRAAGGHHAGVSCNDAHGLCDSSRVSG
jgi:hypothetical protein